MLLAVFHEQAGPRTISHMTRLPFLSVAIASDLSSQQIWNPFITILYAGVWVLSGLHQQSVNVFRLLLRV